MICITKDEVNLFVIAGSALYVFGILEQTQDANYIFFIDGEQVGVYSRAADNSVDILDPFLYNQVLYSNSLVPSGLHTFRLQNGQLGSNSFILFDYVIYTT